MLPRGRTSGMGGGNVTQLLAQWAEGDRGAIDALMPIVYGQLRTIADAYLRRERGGHALQPSELVYEAWLRLVRQDQSTFEHRKQFFALAAQVMRRILVDHARTVNAEKRGGGAVRTPLHDSVALFHDHTAEFLALDEALTHLARVSARQAQIIELRYFGGLNLDEIAGMLGVSLRPSAAIRRQPRHGWVTR